MMCWQPDLMLTSKTQDSWENTFRSVRPDGTVQWIQSRGRVERDADGNVTRLTGLDLDFSQHRRLEEVQEAHRDEEHDRALRMLLESAAQGIISLDDQGIIVTANQAFNTMFGWWPGSSIGERIERMMPSAVHGEHALRGSQQLVGTRRDGSAFPIEVSMTHVPTQGGGRTFAFVTDITERERAEAALQQRTAALEYRTEQLSRMASDLTLADQRAREELAKTLHDGLQQSLVIVALKLEQQLNRAHKRRTNASIALSEAKEQLDQAIGISRSLSFELFPPVLQHSGLPAALSWLGNWTRDKYKVDVRVLADPQANSPRKDLDALVTVAMNGL
jgi:PAS domain S-box-containing protein